MRKPGLHQLKPANLRQTLSDVDALGIPASSFPLVLAQEIVIHTLGGDFWSKECTTFGDRQDFFQTKSDVKVVHLAHHLWNLKECKGFDRFLVKNDKNDFESVYYEACAAGMFLKVSDSVEFVIPTMVKEKDFDLTVRGFHSGEDLKVEVKAKRASFSRINQLRNYLSKYRKQLPQNDKGVIFCKLHIDNACLSQNEMIDATMQTLKNTQRIRFVVYCWDSTNVSNMIALTYICVDSNGIVSRSVFGAETTPLVPSYMIAAAAGGGA